VRWVDLQRDDSVRLELELAKAGTTPAELVRDALDVPELRQRMKLLRSQEARLRLALEYFGDEGHPQPVERTRWPHILVPGQPAHGQMTPDWGLLPRLENDGLPADPQPKPKPRHRPPDQIPESTVKQLKIELVKREAKRKGRRRVPELTQAKIAAIVGLDDTRVQQAEGLREIGWDLLRTHPDFSVDEGFVRWPSVEEATRILDSERTAT
jgi:hypothetical protein